MIQAIPAGVAKQAVAVPAVRSLVHAEAGIIFLDEVSEVSMRQHPDPIQYTRIGDQFNHFYYPSPTEHIVEVSFRHVSERLSEVLMEKQARQFRFKIDRNTQFGFTGILKDYALYADSAGSLATRSPVLCVAQRLRTEDIR